ncbi:MAG: 16S rRNA (cytosine(967)-C(5))-methyltransferase RsmB [Nitrospirae bacterium]|nr:16S rRNA (cytosine(967)-C(5))-methyltransferase RsmB [Nitrospirota bacterium]MCL5238554.1 16S rRNA (cytosine(967)-C(5))-methyltransferase RsmB [Nitrospirota bacterium]
MSPTRELAVIALNNILKKSKKPKEVLEDLSFDLDKRDRAFLMELVYGVLRHRDSLDWMLKDFLRNPSGLPADTLNNLRIAVYQITSMRVPEWAAVNEAVDVEKSYKGKAPLVNAVLRNFLRNRDKIASPPEDNPVGCISITTSHPEWLVRRWVERFGTEEALSLAEKNNEVPPFTIRMGSGAERGEALLVLAEHGIKARPARYSPAGITIEDFHSFDGLSKILPSGFMVQDEASQLMAYLLNPLPGERALDACAAPGGKTTHIAQLMKDGGEVVSVEIDGKKLEHLEQNISRLGLKSVRVIQCDVRNLDNSDYCRQVADRCFFDRILLDAPCSATGVIRRNPDVKYRHGPQDLIRLKRMQLEILHAVSTLLKPGGIMVYSVCSTEPEEGEEVIREFLQGNHGFSIIEGDYDFLRRFEIRDSGHVFYRTFPHRYDMDGFFAARLKKVSVSVISVGVGVS